MLTFLPKVNEILTSVYDADNDMYVVIALTQLC